VQCCGFDKSDGGARKFGRQIFYGKVVPKSKVLHRRRAQNITVLDSYEN
jgi:ribosomal protein S26